MALHLLNTIDSIEVFRPNDSAYPLPMSFSSLRGRWGNLMGQKVPKTQLAGAEDHMEILSLSIQFIRASDYFLYYDTHCLNEDKNLIVVTVDFIISYIDWSDFNCCVDIDADGGVYLNEYSLRKDVCFKLSWYFNV